MGKTERRNAVALDDAYYYCRTLQSGTQSPELYRVCNAIITLDLALDNDESSPIPLTICTEAWSRVRASLFNLLISNFPGYFLLYDREGHPIQPGEDWPATGLIEFYPQCSNRRQDSYTAPIESLDKRILVCLRWAFAEGRQQTLPTDFEEPPAQRPDSQCEETPEDAPQLLQKLYDVCEEEALHGKKKAHRRWWQLYWEANSCSDRRQKHQLEKQMVALQSIWGRPRGESQS